MTARESIGAESALAGAFAAALYAATLAPGIGAGDAGELALAAATLGVPHAPGYPLWTLAASLAARVPFGDLAIRLNALSSLFAAIAAGLLYALARRAGLGRFGASVATILYAASLPVWRSAVQTEVYGLASVAFLALVHLAWTARSRAGAGARADAAYFFAAGLAYLAHQTLAAPALLLGAAVLARRFRARRAAAAAGWTVLGLSPALVVALRSGAADAFAWRIRAPLEALGDVFSRGAYGVVAQNPPRLDLFLGAAAGMASNVASGIGWIAVALAAIAVVSIARSGRSRAAATLALPALAALSIPAALLLLVRFTPDAERLAQVEPFLIPAGAVAALLAGLGASRLVSDLPPRVAAPRAAVAMAISIAVGAGVGIHLEACDRSGFRLPERYGRDLLAALPAGATLVVDGDNETFLAAYLIRHEGLRPDLVVRHRRGCAFGDAYGLAGAPRASWAARANAADRKALAEPGAEIWYAGAPEGLEAAGIRVEPRGLVERAVGAGAAPAPPWTPPAGWPRSGALLGGKPERHDFVTRKLAISYSDAAARAAYARGDAASALAWFEDAARVGYDMPEAQWNLAVAAAAAGEPERALEALLAARALAPHRAESSARLAAFLAAAGRHADAARWFERAFRAEPSAALAADASRAWALAGDAGRSARWRARAASPEAAS